MLHLLITAAILKFELLTPMQKNGKIHDEGFLKTDKFLGEYKHFFISDLATLLNSIFKMACNVFLIYESIFYGFTPVVKGVSFLYWLRFLVGYMTRLPLPSDIVLSDVEIPPKGSNFIYLFSAHTFTITTVGLHMYHLYGSVAGFVFVLVLLLQTLRLLATRGHYSADIIVGFALSILMHNYTHTLMNDD